MSNTVRNLPPLKTFTSSGGAAVSFALGKIDDASSLTLMFTSSFTGTTTTLTLQVSQFDPFDVPGGGYTGTSFGGSIAPPGTSPSSAWYDLSTALVTSSGMALTLSNISFKGLRANGFTATSSAAGEIIAFVCGQYSV